IRSSNRALATRDQTIQIPVGRRHENLTNAVAVDIRDDRLCRNAGKLSGPLNVRASGTGGLVAQAIQDSLLGTEKNILGPVAVDVRRDERAGGAQVLLPTQRSLDAIVDPHEAVFEEVDHLVPAVTVEIRPAA